MTEIKKRNKQIIPNNSFTEFLLYTTPNGKVKVEIFLKDENIWLTQAKIAKLFGAQQPAIAKHLKNIFEARELEENSVHSILEYTASDRIENVGVVSLPYIKGGIKGELSCIKVIKLASSKINHVQR